MDLWGDGKVFVDPAIGNLPAAEIARYLGPGWTIVQGGTYGYQPVTVVPLPDGWAVDFALKVVGSGDASYEMNPSIPSSWEVRNILFYKRADGLVDVYDAAGRYRFTSEPESHVGLLELFTKAVIMAGIGAGIAEIASVAQAGGLASQQPVSPVTSGATNVGTQDVIFQDGFSDWDFSDVGLDDYLGTDPGMSVVDFPTGYPSELPAWPDIPIPDVNISPVPATGSGGSWLTTIRDATGAIREIGGAVIATAQVVRSFNGAVEPASPARVVNANTGTVNGVRPPVGTMQLAADGSAIINNGDGTYTVIRPDGTRYTRSYAGGAIGSAVSEGGLFGLDPKMVAIGAAGVALLLMLNIRGSRSRH